MSDKTLLIRNDKNIFKLLFTTMNIVILFWGTISQHQ